MEQHVEMTSEQLALMLKKVDDGKAFEAFGAGPAAFAAFGAGPFTAFGAGPFTAFGAGPFMAFNAGPAVFENQ
jgi:hypothetical protein